MALSAIVLRRVMTASAVAAAVTIAPIFSAIAQAVTLTGAGATFPDPLYQKYIFEFKKENPGIKVSYQGVGSGAGIRQVIAEVVQFGGSDAAMTDAEMAKVSRGVILVPTAGGAVALVYNLPGVQNLQLARSVLPDIFSGKITRWNDPRIVKDNPGAKLPNSEIKTVVRADGSGTTFIFTNHLSAINPYFKGRIGVGTAPKWTANPIKGRGNPGVAQQVARTEGSIGYVEFSYASEQKDLKIASVQNKNGQFVAPSLEGANAALKSVKFPANNRIFVGDSSDGYPIVGLTWMMIYKQYPAEEAKAIKKWVGWVLSKGQEFNDDLKYTSIPEADRKRIIDTVNEEVKEK